MAPEETLERRWRGEDELHLVPPSMRISLPQDNVHLERSSTPPWCQTCLFNQHSTHASKSAASTSCYSSDLSKGVHWALYHHRTPHGGYNFNVKQMGSGCICDSGQNDGIMQSFLLDGCASASGAEALAWIDQVYLTEPPTPFHTFTCRTWTMYCVRGLVRQGFVKCEDPGALEREAKEWATRHHESAHDGVMPRPIEDSRVCTL